MKHFFVTYTLYEGTREYGDNFLLNAESPREAELLASTYIDTLAGEQSGEIGAVTKVKDYREWLTLIKYLSGPITWDDVADQLGLETGEQAKALVTE